MKSLTHTKVAASVMTLIFPFMMSCSVLSGNSSISSDPVVAEQQRRIETLKADEERAEQDLKEAKAVEEAAESSVKAAKDELKVLQNQEKRSSISGNSVSEQKRRIETLEEEEDRAEKDVDDAKAVLNAAESAVKAAQDELKVLQNQAARRTS